MLRTTNRIASEFESISAALVQLEQEPGFEGALKVVDALTSLLGISTLGTERLYNVDKIKQNPGWFIPAQGFADRRACYKLADDNAQNIDIKLYWVQKTSRRIISSAVMFTANFEDEPFNTDLNIGIDFFIPASADRVIMALSNRYLIRTLELQGSLGITQQEIFNKWIQNLDFANKTQTHKVLWESLDLQPLNKQFYKEVTRFFIELIQHLEKDTKLFQPKEAAQFTNRLIGRLIFCWFLRKKQIIADDHAYFELDDNTDSSAYYHNGLEKLFFSILNTKIEERDVEDKTTPFLNGGLFEARESDHRGNKELTFPKDYFHRFFQFLDGYNFTTDESTSEFQQVAIDPEMLGRIFENLLAEQTEETGQQARKAKGAFYTPREIVDYMCKESLREYIRTKLPDDNKRDQVLELLFDKKEHQLDYKSLAGNLKDYKKTILDALDEITILDPACGSGAFPMGMLQLMLSIYERIDARFDSYKTKLGIVKNNLFGVDIEPMAVEISRLRAWLSIIVDVDMNPTKENLGIEPLPNLEFKFVAANSLIPLEAGGTEQMEFDNKNLQEEMSRIRDRYFNTNSGKVKEKMKLDYEKLLCSGNTMFKSDRQKKLLTYHPFDSSKSAGFFDPKLMFGLEGFDVVIGNPPYIEFKKLRDKELYSDHSSAKGKYDIYVLFFEMAAKKLTDGGNLVFITPTTFLKKDFGKSIRKYILSNFVIIKILDFSDIKMFESAINYTGIFVFKKENSLDYSFKYHAYKNTSSGNRPEVVFSSIAADKSDNYKDVIDVKSECLKEHNWNFQNDSFRSLLKKISKETNTLEFFTEEIFQGIASGKDNVFYINQSDVEENKLEMDLLRPIVKGKDVKAYKIKWSGSYVVYPYDNNSKVLPESTLQSKYPHIYSYLKSKKDQLSGRGYFSKSSKKWYELWNQRKVANFDQTRIVVPEISGKSNFAITDKYYGNTKTYHIILKEKNETNYKYFLGLLNSSLLSYIYKHITTPQAGGFFAYKTQFLKQIPIRLHSNFEKSIASEVELLMNETIEKNVHERKIKIDELVMDLYQLTEEEKEIIRRAE